MAPGRRPILLRFRAALDVACGPRLERVVLYGSRARGEAGPHSDYDLAVFLRDMPDRAVELDRLADLGTEILYETGELVHAMPYLAETYDDQRMPLSMRSVAKASICEAAGRGVSRKGACASGPGRSGPSHGIRRRGRSNRVSGGLSCGQALIFERHERVLKSHTGVHGEFARLVKDDPRFDAELRMFLRRAYQLKANADSETGPAAEVTNVRASEAISVARRFVGVVAAAIA